MTSSSADAITPLTTPPVQLEISLITGLLLVGLLWGGTNPYLREAALTEAAVEEAINERIKRDGTRTNGTNATTKDGKIKIQPDGKAAFSKPTPIIVDPNKTTTKPRTLSLSALYRTMTNASFYLPFVLNQTGSVVYYFLLGSYEVSVMVPAANGFALLVTAITEFCRAKMRGEEKQPPHPREALGMFLILIGFALCTRAAEGSS